MFSDFSELLNVFVWIRFSPPCFFSANIQWRVLWEEDLSFSSWMKWFVVVTQYMLKQLFLFFTRCINSKAQLWKIFFSWHTEVSQIYLTSSSCCCLSSQLSFATFKWGRVQHLWEDFIWMGHADVIYHFTSTYFLVFVTCECCCFSAGQKAWKCNYCVKYKPAHLRKMWIFLMICGCLYCLYKNNLKIQI